MPDTPMTSAAPGFGPHTAASLPEQVRVRPDDLNRSLRNAFVFGVGLGVLFAGSLALVGWAISWLVTGSI